MELGLDVTGISLYVSWNDRSFKVQDDRVLNRFLAPINKIRASSLEILDTV